MNTFDYLTTRHSQVTKFPVKLPYTRVDLAKWFYQAGFLHGAEIGVERGLYAEVLCENNPNLILHCIDPWVAYRGYREHVTQERLDGFYAEAVKRLDPYHTKIMRFTSAQAATHFDDASLDFIYIDGNHEFSHIAQDVCLWVPKVKRGGIVAGHDFTRRKGKNYINHVKDVIQAYAYSHEIRPWFTLVGDKSPSWFWRKQ